MRYGNISIKITSENTYLLRKSKKRQTHLYLYLSGKTRKQSTKKKVRTVNVHIGLSALLQHFYEEKIIFITKR